MFGSVVLEVVLGLVFVYAWFSLACSAIVEYLESFRGQRGKQLAIAVERMIGKELKQRFYQHGLIQSLSKSGRLPSYLPARSFASVTLDLLGVGAAQFRQQLDALPGELGDALRVLTKDGESYEQVVHQLEQWFDHTMDRCSGWFRRRTRLAAFLTGLVVASLLNVDSVEIASALYADTHLRLSVVAQAEAEGQVPIVRRTADKGQSVMQIPIESGTLPLGWENSRFATRAQWAEHPWSQPAFWLGPVLMKVLGLLVTALAGSLGAAFWFDALKRLLTLRSSLSAKSGPSGGGSGVATVGVAAAITSTNGALPDSVAAQQLAVASAPARPLSARRTGSEPTTLSGFEGPIAPGSIEIDPIVSLDSKPRP